jgi:toxin ParE1/3/4
VSRYTLSPLARDDIKGICRYVAADNISASRRLRAILVDKFRLLAAQPLLGETRDDLAENLRMLTAGNYLILYRPAGHGIEVSRVIHAARDIAVLWR